MHGRVVSVKCIDTFQCMRDGNEKSKGDVVFIRIAENRPKAASWLLAGNIYHEWEKNAQHVLIYFLTFRAMCDDISNILLMVIFFLVIIKNVFV